MFFLSSSVDFRDFFYVSWELCKNTAKTVIVLLLLQNRMRFMVVPLFYYTLLFYKMEYCSLPLPFCVLQCGSSIMNFPSILAFTKIIGYNSNFAKKLEIITVLNDVTSYTFSVKTLFINLCYSNLVLSYEQKFWIRQLSRPFPVSIKTSIHNANRNCPYSWKQFRSSRYKIACSSSKSSYLWPPLPLQSK